MVRRTAVGLFFAWPLMWVASAIAQHSNAVNIVAGPLPDSLASLERQTGIELLFDNSLVSGVQSPAVRGDLTTEAALRELLAATELTVRRAESGAWIVEAPAGPPLARPDAIVPEILIIGHRTQNADIRRIEDDVQPYTIVTKEEIVGAHRDNIDQYFTSRITSNAQVVPAGLSQVGDPRSSIDIRGLGPDYTLVLIDGRRMPSMPDIGNGFGQSDLNAIPLHAIERIEVLTGAAGGIYGFGALGGVVNVVLDRSNRGIELDTTWGISSRGDAAHRTFEANFGHTSEDGRTDFTFFAAHSESDPLLVGERGSVVRDQQLNAALQGPIAFLPSPGNSVAIVGLGSNLVFKPQFGGATLASNRTFLPVGFSGGAAALSASLTQHAGQSDLSLSDGEADSDLLTNSRYESLLVNARHRFGGGVEIYADAIVLSGRGQSTNRSADGEAFMPPNSPANPFTNYIQVYFPVSQMGQQYTKQEETSRYTAGLLAELPFNWRGTVDVGAGSLNYSTAVARQSPSQPFLLLTGAPSDLLLNPLGNWNAFQQTYTADPDRNWLSTNFHNQFWDESLRLAGPIFSTAQGPATLTLQAEHRTEAVPAGAEVQTLETGGITTPSTTPFYRWSMATTSLYAELRSRVFAASGPFPFLRGLELQLAVRRDDQGDDFARNALGNDNSDRLQAHFVGTDFTAGAKVTPWPWLMLRASYATGEEPPQLSALSEADEQATNLPFGTDPKRAGTFLGADAPYLYKSGGYLGLKAVRANTAFLGTVLTPLGEDGPRLAIDFSRIREPNGVLDLSPQIVLDNEDFWPQRVTRAPLTAADRALGYTAGPVIMLDTRAMNGAALEVAAIDAHAEWPLRFLRGRLRLYIDGTYHMNDRQTGLFQPAVQGSGNVVGPLKWRVNGGFEWSKDPLTIGANLQYFGSSLVTLEGLPSVINDEYVQAQGSTYVPSQIYLDLHAAWRFPMQAWGHSGILKVDLGVVNVLDRAPPRESPVFNGGPGYSPYGDPRQRRFDVALSGHF